jgi:prophage antirepressor-like protein
MTAPEIVPFLYDGTIEVRGMQIDGEPWFVHTDCCSLLGLTNSRMVIERLDKAGVNKTYISSGGQKRQVTIINEPNVWRLINRSNKPEAVTIQNWFYNEVLPTIRKTGKYELPGGTPEPEPPADVYDLMHMQIDRIKSVECIAREADEVAHQALSKVDELRGYEGWNTAVGYANDHDWVDKSRPAMKELGVIAANGVLSGRWGQLNLPNRWAPHVEFGKKRGQRLWPDWVWDLAAIEFLKRHPGAGPRETKK